MPEHKPTLVIFCKRPALYQGKQRLAKTIGAAQALLFAQAFLACTLEDARAWPGPVVLSPASVDDHDWAATLWLGAEVMAQPDGGLGDRLLTIDQQLRDQGHQQIIFMGTDAPMLSPAHFEQARRALDDHDIILSPALDGGVTLMGARRSWPQMADLPWSTDRLGYALEQLCQAQGYPVKNIRPSYDIDVAEDMPRLWRDLSTDPRPARRALYDQLGAFLTPEGVQYG